MKSLIFWVFIFIIITLIACIPATIFILVLNYLFEVTGSTFHIPFNLFTVLCIAWLMGLTRKMLSSIK